MSSKTAGALSTLVVLAALQVSQPALAQVQSFAIGLTPSCPYPQGCWSAAPEALGRMNLGKISAHPDYYNWMVTIYPKDAKLPDVEQLRSQFKKFAHEAVGFRGVEVTMGATVVADGNGLALVYPGQERKLRAAPLQHKLHWNLGKHNYRQPEPDEANAFESLKAAQRSSGAEPLRVIVTGPLVPDADADKLEIREFTVLNQPKAPTLKP